MRAPESFPSAAFGRTKAGALSISVDPTIISEPHVGFTIKFTKVSAKPFRRDNKVVSQVGDYLRACGFNGVLGNEQQIADAVETTVGAVYQAKIDWRAYNTKTGFQLQGMERFPKLTDGTGYQSWIEDPTPGAVDENGAKYKVRANIVVDRFLPQGE